MSGSEKTPELLSRRGALVLLGGLGLAVAGCSGGNDSGRATATTRCGGATTTTAGAATVTSCSEIAEETGGPFPGDGSNGPDVLSQSGVVRQDIRSSFGSSSGTAEGVPYTISFTVVDIDNGCQPLTGAAVYVWHCDRDGNYSMYQDASDQNYLRGVQPVDADGVATFTSIFPACYSGRWPHVHFEVYPSVDAATERQQPAGHVADRDPPGRVRRGLRDRRLRAERAEPRRCFALLRHGVLRRGLDRDAVDDRERDQGLPVVVGGRSVERGLTGRGRREPSERRSEPP